MSQPPATLFDSAALAKRAARAARHWPASDFLHARAAEGIAERMADAPRSFPRLAVVGAGGGLVARALAAQAGSGGVATMDAGAMAALAGGVAGDEPIALGEGGFDAVASGLWLHRANDPVGALIQMRRLLRPDGMMVAAAFGGRTLHELRAAWAEAEIEVEGGVSPRVHPMADLREMGALLQRAGFHMPAADVERLTVDYADPFALMRDLRLMGEANAMTARRRTFTRRATMLRMAEIYARHFGRADGRVTATFEIVYLAGWSPGPEQPQPRRPGSARARLADALGTFEMPAGEKAGR
ncbi:MAG: class I SAM-dependent methyltransferase [Rubrimonas sp.]